MAHAGLARARLPDFDLLPDENLWTPGPMEANGVAHDERLRRF